MGSPNIRRCLRTLVLTILASPAFADWQVGQTVQTSSGPVNGHAAKNAKGVSEYLGIPYAEPPVDDLRWAEPVNYDGTETVNGTAFGFACMQPGFSIGSTGISTRQILPNLNLTVPGIALLESYARTVPPQSEDCLTLNVWTKPQTGDAKKAVMVWIHGGGWTTGSSGISWYNGQFFADEEDVVIVSINYRLNIFGFPGNPDVTPNLGLLDQRLAIEWVRNNIEAFGGDPERIVLFGQSVGGASVDMYTYAWTSDPIVKGVIAQSGVAWSFPIQTQDTATDQWQDVAKSLGCTGDPSETLDCMRKLSAQKLVKADQVAQKFGTISDEKLVFSDYPSRKPAAIPVVVGHTDFEPGLNRALSTVELAESVWDNQQHNIWQCPTAQRTAYSVNNGVPTWRYRWFGAFPNTILSNDPPSGAYHTSELPILFGTVLQTVVASTPAENDISSYMRGAWAAFAKDPEKGLLSYSDGWPQYTADGDTLVQLAFDSSKGTNLADGASFDSGCSVPSSTGTPSGTGTSTPTPTPSNLSGHDVVPSPAKVLAAVLACILLATL
ncbi:uncharacterized protein JN550_009316 [Neoarthrinium moseri]|uniref:uncharacterized protein n=1 Tax=Neoarthrinium moseri TaxID=1658444 RepID=UPI001FDE91B9|nr:uncharacterized protein JN550_009316 [Neoarthrinium moseri]KAI1863818.1 hypothetical protein JN550_009316 [Neoarthrinium moseri]